MATAAEKQYAQAVKDQTKAEVVAGRGRLNATVPKAAGAFPQRRLRSSGDLSRYAIGGFLDDALPPVPTPGPTATAKAAGGQVTAKKQTAAAPVRPTIGKLTLPKREGRSEYATGTGPKGPAGTKPTIPTQGNVGRQLKNYSSKYV